MMILLLIQKQNLALAVYLLGSVLSLPDLGLQENTCDNALTMTPSASSRARVSGEEAAAGVNNIFDNIASDKKDGANNHGLHEIAKHTPKD